MAITAGQEGRASDFINISAGVGDAGKVPKLNASGRLDTSFIRNVAEMVIFTSSGTWTKDAGLKYIVVEVIGGGGGAAGAGSGSGINGGGGGAGGYSKEIILASALGATETVTIGTAGAGGTGYNDGAAGGTTSFGAFLQATGGGGSVRSTSLSLGAVGGTGSGGDVSGLGGFGGDSPGSYQGGITQNLSYGKGGNGNGANGLAGTAGGVIVTEYYN